MSTTTSPLAAEIDSAAQAIKVAKNVAANIATMQQTLYPALSHIEDALRSISPVDPAGADDRMKLERRISRIRELLNMAELGSFSVEVSRAMDAAWRRLP